MDFLKKVLKKHDETPDILKKEKKFIKWSNAIGNNTYEQMCVDLKLDENSFVLYWRNNGSKIGGYLDIACIRDVRIGKNANIPKDKNIKDVLINVKSNIPIEEKTMSIYYGNDYAHPQCINFVSLSNDAQKVVQEWSNYLFEIAFSPKTQNLSPWENIIKLRSIILYDKGEFNERTRTFGLPVPTFVDIFANSEKQHAEVEREFIKHAMQAVELPYFTNDYLDENHLTKEKFTEFILRILGKQTIESVFSTYGKKASGKDYLMTVEQFENFLNTKQRDPRLNEQLNPHLSIKQVQSLIHKFEINPSFKKKDHLSPEGLLRYLMDSENAVFDAVKLRLSEDMTQPLSHYFINSSHNTYLSGAQVNGESDCEMYRQSLLLGCRCIELDCWDNKNLDEPIITHGYCFCTEILFKDVILTIKEYAFKTTPYPLLLSFENHCSKQMQEKMARYLIEIFGESLLIDPLPQYPLKPGVKLPSPEDLKYKILIKNTKKKLPDQKFGPSNDIPKIESKKSELRSFKTYKNEDKIEEISQNNDENQTKNQAAVENEEAPGSESEISSIDEDEEDEFEKEKAKKIPEKIVTAEMSNLVNYLQPIKFKSFEAAEKLNRAYEMCSMKETKGYSLHKDKPIEFINYNKRSISRIYPKGSRISSDNYMPQIFWNVGCQMVALNFQTLDVPMQLNLGKFENNNRCGYLLKPEEMRNAGLKTSYDPFATSLMSNIVPQTLEIQILSGIFLDVKKPHSVTIEMYGIPFDTIRGQRAYKIKLISSNSINGVFQDTKFKFDKILMPKLALLRLSAYDEQKRFICQRVLPITDIKSGYRYICMKTESNQPINMCMLFANIHIEDYVAEEFRDLVEGLENPSYFQNQEEEQKGGDDKSSIIEKFRMMSLKEKHEILLQLLAEEEEEITHF